MRLLILSPLYHPSQSPNVYRWDAITRYWVAQGHEVHWICSRLGKEPIEARKNGIFIYRTGHNTLLDWWCNLLGINKKRRGLEGSGLPRINQFRRFLERIVDLTWRKLYWPDGACLWYLPGRRKALELVNQYEFNAVISVSMPFTSALIAKSIKEKRPKIKWLMDIEDPFSFVVENFINNRTLYKGLNTKAEKKAMLLADSVSVTVDAAKQKYISHFPFVKEKISVTPPLWEEIIPKKILQNESHRISGNINLGYFGTFYYPIRSPEGFLKLLSSLVMELPDLANRLTIHFVGVIPMEYASMFSAFPELSSILRFYGLVSRARAATIMQEMDFLVNIGNLTDYHLPSKSAEYLVSGKPIINVACIQDDTVADFMKAHPLFLNLVLENHLATEKDMLSLSKFLVGKVGNALEKKEKSVYRSKYKLETIAEKYMILIINE